MSEQQLSQIIWEIRIAVCSSILLNLLFYFLIMIRLNK